jgi:membrane-associated phospholipid phosphatase
MQEAMKTDAAASHVGKERHGLERPTASAAFTENWRRWLLPPLAMSLLAVVALTIDLPVAQWAAGRSYPRLIRELMSLAEAFGHGVGVAVALITVYTLDPARRRMLPRSILVVASAGCGANLVKLLVARQRPGAADLLHADVWHTFAGWLPLARNGSALQSFPSAHTATAVGLAMVLSSLYPQGRRLFFLFAAAVGVQRVLGGAHYPSDVLGGAAVGWLFAAAAFHLVARLPRERNRVAQPTEWPFPAGT